MDPPPNRQSLDEIEAQYAGAPRAQRTFLWVFGLALAAITQGTIFAALDRVDPVISVYGYTFFGSAWLGLDQALGKRDGIPGPHWRRYWSFVITMIALTGAMLGVIVWVPKGTHLWLAAAAAVLGTLLVAYGIALYVTPMGIRLIARAIGTESTAPFAAEFNVGSVLLTIPFGLCSLLAGLGQLVTPVKSDVQALFFLAAGLCLVLGFVGYFRKPAWARPRWMRHRMEGVVAVAEQLEELIATQDFRLSGAMDRILGGLGWFGWLHRKSFHRGCRQFLKLSPVYRAELEALPPVSELEQIVRERLEGQIQLEKLVAALSEVDYDRREKDRALLKQIYRGQVNRYTVRRRRQEIEKFYGPPLEGEVPAR